MKHQVTRLSPHQNSKVAAILMAFLSLVLFAPFAIITGFFAPQGKGPSLIMLLIMPVIYLVVTYLMTAFYCWAYNLLTKYIGGIEYETREADANA
jgi:hypothetical protein